jgi:hypothetical protein
MRTLLVFSFILCGYVYSQDKSLVPSLVEYSNYYINKGVVNGDQTRVYGTYFNRFEEAHYAKSKSFWIETSIYRQNQKLGKSVFRARPENDSRYSGTAFHLGGNYILTNFHVYHTGFKDVSCRKFKIKIAYPNDRYHFSCLKKIHCSKKLDYCVIKMKPQHRTGLNLPRVSQIRFNTNPIMFSDFLSTTTVIGNTSGHGVQASSGRGLIKGNRGLYFFSPIWGGNSGSPLFNNEMEVIGIVARQSKKLYGEINQLGEFNLKEDPYNFAFAVTDIISDLEEQEHVPTEVIQFFY